MIHWRLICSFATFTVVHTCWRRIMQLPIKWWIDTQIKYLIKISYWQFCSFTPFMLSPLPKSQFGLGFLMYSFTWRQVRKKYLLRNLFYWAFIYLYKWWSCARIWRIQKNFAFISNMVKGCVPLKKDKKCLGRLMIVWMFCPEVLLCLIIALTKLCLCVHTIVLLFPWFCKLIDGWCSRGKDLCGWGWMSGDCSIRSEFLCASSASVELVFSRTHVKGDHWTREWLASVSLLPPYFSLCYCAARSMQCKCFLWIMCI